MTENSVAEEAYNEAVSFLQKAKSTAGTSVYEHLKAVLAKILDEKPTNAVDLLETSLLTKKTTFQAKENTPLVPPKDPKEAAKTVAATNLFVPPESQIDPETGEPREADPPNEFECEDFWRDALLFDALGVGLGLDEMYNVMLTVKRLGEDPSKGVATVRFMGKFLGLAADYYVFETTLNDPPEEPDQSDLPEGEVPMEVNTGSNGYVYWACNYLGGPITQLPSVRPAEVKAARTIKKFLTGDLSAPVSTFPVFPGNEAVFLRAQIARIVATTVVCPNGMFQLDEEEAGLERNEEFEELPANELVLRENWAHRYPHLKKQGRCEVFRKEEDEEEDEEPPEPTEEESEEGPELLTTLDNDAPVGAHEPWTPLTSSSNEQVKFQVAGLRSNLWPGAVAAAKGQSFANIYIGWGLKNVMFTPQPPPPVANEFDMTEMESTELPPKPEREEPPVEDEEEPED
uniref:Radial spoke head protein 4 a n=1 Tax=Tetraselmis sp. GSL018 TaxID=582737 RepID=A0A061R768_9CHLO